MGVFDELAGADQNKITHEAERFDNDIRDAVRLLMQRREGRTFINWLIEGQDPRAIMWRVMQYIEEGQQHG